MFVFKAAVVGAGTMGGEIAQVIAASGVPVVLKDVYGLSHEDIAEEFEVLDPRLERAIAGGRLVLEHERGERHAVCELAPEVFDGIDVALFDVPDDVSKQWAPIAVEHDATVDDNFRRLANGSAGSARRA